MERVVTATEARVRFGEMMRRVVEDDEAIIVERDGKRQVVLISIDEYDHYKAKKPSWEFLLEQSHELVAQEMGDRKLPPAEEIISKMREERDGQLQDLLR